MRIVHFCAGLEKWNGMANTARQFVAEEIAAGHDSRITSDLNEIIAGVDVVHLHGAWLPVLWSAAKRAKKIGAKLIIRPAGSYDPVRLAYHGWKKRLVAPFEHRMLRRADVVQATCAAEAEWIRAYEPRVDVKITDLKRFFDLNGRGRCPQRPATDVKRALAFDNRCGGLRTSRPTESPRSIRLLYLGRRHPLKGVEYLERAVEEMKRSGDRFPVGLELKVVSNATGEELEKVWEWCDVLVLPTLSENFGRVVAEALERGKRVVTTDGAPVWEGQPGVVYLKGYREGTDEERVELLKRGLKESGSGTEV